MKGGIGQLMKQAQQMQQKMKEAQDEMASMTVTGQAGGGMVQVTMTGQHQVTAVNIDDAVIGDDKEMLEDLVLAALNDAHAKVQAEIQDKFSGMAAGAGLPPGFKLPF